MLNRLHLTQRQRRIALKWTLYTVLFLLTMMVQTVCLGNVEFFGVHLHLLMILVCCVCLRESPESGGVYALCMSLLWCLSGADGGSLSIVVWTGLGIGLSLLCRTLINGRILTCALCCLGAAWLEESILFLSKRLINHIPWSYYLTKALPCVLLSMILFPAFYGLVKCISRTGEIYGA